MSNVDTYVDIIRKTIMDNARIISRSKIKALFDNERFKNIADFMISKLTRNDEISNKKLNAKISSRSRTGQISEKTLNDNASKIAIKLANLAKTKDLAIQNRSADSSTKDCDSDVLGEYENIVADQIPDECISKFEDEFNARINLIDKKSLKKLKSSGLLKKLFSSWMISLCALSCMVDCSGGDLNEIFGAGINLFE